MRVVIFLLLLGSTAFANSLTSTSLPHPLFLKLGFSSIVEFDETPIRVVIGDSQAFQVEKMDKSLVIRTLVNYATSNLFVYFKDAPPKLFTLTASEDSTPSLYSKFEITPLKAPTVDKAEIIIALPKVNKSGVKLTSAKFDKTKDYLTIDFLIIADSKSLVQPKWDQVRLAEADKKIAPYKIWSERQEIQKDSSIKARFIFLRPNVNKTLNNCTVIIPLKGRSDVFHLNLGKGK